jgi:hypothetical protein
MDELKVKLSTRFMRSIVSKLISKTIHKKYGYKVKIHLNDLDISIIDGETSIKTNLEVTLNSDEFKKIMSSIGLD